MTASYGTAKWIVNPDPTLGNFTTISAALAAVPGQTIFVCDGTYVEDFTVPAGTNLVAWGAYWSTKAIIRGKISVSGGAVNINGFELETNGDNILSITGSNQSIIKFQNCNFNISNATGIFCTSSNNNTIIFISNCTGDVSANGYAVFDMYGGGIGIIYSRFTNNGASTTPCRTHNGASWAVENGYWEHPVLMDGTGLGECSFSFFDSTTTVQTCITMTGSTTLFTVGGRLQSWGTGCCVNVGSGCHYYNQNCVLNGGNSQLVQGAGICEYAGIQTLTANATLNAGQLVQDRSFSGPLSFDNGANFLNAYSSGTWIPALTFGGNSIGMVYASRSGFWTRIGNVVFGNFNILITNKGSSLGNALVTGLPFAAGPTNGNSYQNLGFLYGITLDAGYNYPYCSVDCSTSHMSLGQTGTTGGVSLYLNNTNFANFSQIIGQFSYIIV